MQDPRSLTLVVLVLALSDCSTFDGLEEPRVLAPSNPARPVEPVTPLEAPPEETPLDERSGVFVSPRGSDAADGSRSHPLATLSAAVAFAKHTGRRVYACAGTYRETLVVLDGVSMFGDLSCADGFWRLDLHARAVVEAPVSPAAAAVGVVRPTLVEGFDVRAPAAIEPGRSSVALRAVNAPALILGNVRLVAGRGANGAPGRAGVALTPSPRSEGASGAEQRACDAYGGDTTCFRPSEFNRGGDGRCLGAVGHDAGDGGTGGRGGTYVITDGVYAPVAFGANAGGPVVDEVALGASAPGGAAGGLTATNAEDGRSGAAGVDGRGGTLGWLAGYGDFVPANGVAGTDGSPGFGGGGAAGRRPVAPPFGTGAWRGYGGGGGGAGGCPGLAGEAGGGGGASIALIAIGSPLTVRESELLADAGGDGGAAGLPSAARPGGRPGNERQGVLQGGRGGVGGDAGLSGPGAGGPSFGVAWVGAAPALTSSTITLGKGGRGFGAPSAGDRAALPSNDGPAEAVHAFDARP